MEQNDRPIDNDKFVAYFEALAALVAQSTQQVFDPLEVHCCLKDLEDAFDAVLSSLEVPSP